MSELGYWEVCPPVSKGLTYTLDQALTNVTSLQWQTQNANGAGLTLSGDTVGFWVDQVCLTFANPTQTQTAVIVSTATRHLLRPMFIA